MQWLEEKMYIPGHWPSDQVVLSDMWHPYLAARWLLLRLPFFRPVDLAEKAV